MYGSSESYRGLIGVWTGSVTVTVPVHKTNDVCCFISVTFSLSINFDFYCWQLAAGRAMPRMPRSRVSDAVQVTCEVDELAS